MTIEEPKCNQCGKKGTIYAVDPCLEEYLSEDGRDKLVPVWWCEACYIDTIRET